MSKFFIIAIDGPAGSGKSALAKEIAKRLNFLYVDTGAMFRAVTYIALSKGIASDADAVGTVAADLDIKLKFENGITRVFVNGAEVTEYIRSKEVNSLVSEISVIPQVRKRLLFLQRRYAELDNLVAEGRDTTTVVYPNADLKIFLTANLEIRASRRLKDFEKSGINISLEEVKANLAKRDEIDSSRDLAPLMKADGALEIDTTKLTIDEEIELIINKYEEFKSLNSHPN